MFHRKPRTPIDVTRLSSPIAAGVDIAGDIRYRQLQMECGAMVDGTLESLADGAGTHASPVSNVVTLPRMQVLAAGDHDTGG